MDIELSRPSMYKPSWSGEGAVSETNLPRDRSRSLANCVDTHASPACKAAVGGGGLGRNSRTFDNTARAGVQT